MTFFSDGWVTTQERWKISKMEQLNMNLKKLLSWNKNSKSLLYFSNTYIYMFRCVREIGYVCKIIILKVIEIKRRKLYFFINMFFYYQFCVGMPACTCVHACVLSRKIANYFFTIFYRLLLFIFGTFSYNVTTNLNGNFQSIKTVKYSIAK